MTHLPLIGVTLDAEQPGGYSKLPWYALRQNYFSAIVEAHGLPVALPHHPELAEAFLDRIAGLVVTGGAFDVDPALYGAGEQHETVVLKASRTDFELAMVRGALARDMPVLGICGGQQLLAVALGGTLVQHIPDTVPDALAHEQPNPRTEPGHAITITQGTLLARVTGVAWMEVNSAHHQAVASVGAGSVVNAVAPDGVIEGIESSAHRFALGVQWHPEYSVDPQDSAIIRAFIAACAAGVPASARTPVAASASR
jgi:putative glutamine amidotransferase